ncbi:MAG TPA: hypothetical protein VN087_10335 [Verrucomicrobiae bacterium]|jgi:hypothetical protein|nr:hypothetical protein [Verrucomicrobiae bacterium]
MPRVRRLFRPPKRGWPMEELPEVAAVEGAGQLEDGRECSAIVKGGILRQSDAT